VNRPPRRCVNCTRLIPYGSRCVHCQKVLKAKYKGDWAITSQQLRDAYPWCWSCGSTSDLTVDHVLPGSRAAGLAVMCRSCNSRKRDSLGKVPMPYAPDQSA
jgi:hypothetical protein